jgi:hypothetical protein
MLTRGWLRPRAEALRELVPRAFLHLGAVDVAADRARGHGNLPAIAVFLAVAAFTAIGAHSSVSERSGAPDDKSR